ncbi:hypothetical protein [Rhizohabitans arisaemae]|uniref:hypothetical protein n=1 Tax=Rhizohabitans arisaemae TaxID=2720610 RepID=UPI0024B1D54C|nr:hypothetical protein [Rhizohabitans arisaemae]
MGPRVFLVKISVSAEEFATRLDGVRGARFVRVLPGGHVSVIVEADESGGGKTVASLAALDGVESVHEDLRRPMD